jgi:hypothetical protein
LLGKRIRAGVAAFGIAAAIMVVASAPAGALDGGTSVRARNGYVNPFKPRRWDAGRIDMGVDYTAHRRQAVVAIGDAKILGSSSDSGWPGGHYIWYRLLDGDHAGNFIYVAEYLRRLVPKGTRVQAGERIATARPRSSGLEIGWASRRGEPRAAPCYSEGLKTHSGREMARFLRSLGAEVGDRPGPVPDHPSGKRC